MKKVKDLGKETFVEVYLPIAGHKAQVMTWEDEMECHTPWMTSPMAWNTYNKALGYAISWAYTESCLLIVSGCIVDLEGKCPTVNQVLDFVNKE